MTLELISLILCSCGFWLSGFMCCFFYADNVVDFKCFLPSDISWNDMMLIIISMILDLIMLNNAVNFNILHHWMHHLIFPSSLFYLLLDSYQLVLDFWILWQGVRAECLSFQTDFHHKSPDWCMSHCVQNMTVFTSVCQGLTCICLACESVSLWFGGLLRCCWQKEGLRPALSSNRVQLTYQQHLHITVRLWSTSHCWLNTPSGLWPPYHVVIRSGWQSTYSS